MAIITPRPDLLDVLTRRKRTVANFLETKNVKTHKELEALLLELEKEFFVSGEFYRLCGEVMPDPGVPVIPALPTPLPYPDIHIALSPEEIDQVLDDPASQEILEKANRKLKKATKKHAKKD